MGDPGGKQLRENQGQDNAADSSDALAPGKRPLTTPSRGGATNTPGKRSGTQDLKPGSPEERGGRAQKGGAKTKPTGGGGAGAGGTVTAGGAKGGGGGGGGGGAAGFSGGGGVLGDAIKAQLAAFQGTVKGNAETVQQPAGTDGKPKKESEEDHAKKVEQYEDGVDGIADMIGDLDAFDDLCGAFSTFGDGDKGKQQEALGRIRTSKPFHNLAQMWQGALDGGPDAPKMMAVFERQFTARGFWGTTMQAYALVRDDAKRQAKEDADAAAAKKKAKDAKAKADKEAQEAADKAAGKANAGKGDGKGIDGGAGGAGGASGLNAVVSADMAPMPAFAQLSKVTDADFSHAMATADMHAMLQCLDSR